MKIDEFRKLNQDNQILHIGNVWDINSALILQRNGYKALGTSSAAIASSLGYEDGEQMSFDELFQICKQIISKINVPLSVDIEAGYSRDVKQIIKNIIALHDIGVVGINIEDSVVQNSKREIEPKEKFAKLLEDIKIGLKEKNIDMFINARTDNFIMGLDNPLADTIERIKSYEPYADGIFVPCIVDIEDIKEVAKATTLPINVMAMPGLASFDILQKAGIKRASRGPFVYNGLVKYFENIIKTVRKDNSFESIF